MKVLLKNICYRMNIYYIITIYIEFIAGFQNSIFFQQLCIKIRMFCHVSSHLVKVLRYQKSSVVTVGLLLPWSIVSKAKDKFSSIIEYVFCYHFKLVS